MLTDIRRHHRLIQALRESALAQRLFGEAQLQSLSLKPFCGYGAIASTLLQSRDR
jgi:hypothetical protein